MSKLIDAIRTNDSLTANGMTTNSTSLNNCVDLFFTIGAMRGEDKTRLINSFTKALNEDALTAIKLLFWARDVRGGAGERQIFRDIITYIANSKDRDILRKNLSLISEFGRWDDLLMLVGTPLEGDALDLIGGALEAGNGLAAKWMPRPNVTNREKKKLATVLRKHLGLDPKTYRKMLVSKTNVVEQLMCSKDFASIDYSKLPSKAMSDYMKAFGRNDYERFSAFLNSVDKGETKINTGAIYPYDVLKNMKMGHKDGADTQWNSLPNYMLGSKELILPMVDVSGSMSCSAGNNKNVTCMDVAISLGLYISERNVGPFKDAFLTFDAVPTLNVVAGTLSERYNQMERSEWGQNTDIQAAFKLILNKAVASNVSQNDMPTMMMILSDMEFDSANGGRHGWGSKVASEWNPTAKVMIEEMYNKAGYKMPKIVFWNIHSSNDSNKPVSANESGVAMVSGFSPTILTNLLSGKDMTPYTMMMDVVNSERYDSIKI